MTTTEPYHDGVVQNPNDITVAVRHLGGRAEKLMVPLRASDMEIVVDPPSLDGVDVVMLDQPRYNLAHEVVRNGDVPVVYRVRGNLWKEMDIRRFGRTKKVVATNLIYPRLDGAIAVDGRLAGIFQDKTGVETHSAGLVKEPSLWENARHTGSALELLTLTNFNYNQKVMPMKPYIQHINRWLDDNGGHWYLCGEGIHADHFAEYCAGLENVSYHGYVDPHEYLPRMDAMIHVSEFDALPNSVLEGFASNLPVLTNDFAAFDREDAPNITHSSPLAMVDTLKKLRDAEVRQHYGRRGRDYLAAHHSRECVARQYEQAFAQVIR